MLKIKLLVDDYINKDLKKALKLDENNKILREEFLTRFPASNILNLQKDEYVTGKQNETSFCNFLETKLRSDGSIKGGTPADKKFGFYYSKPLGKYIWLEKRWGNDENIAFESILKSINELLIVGKTKSFTDISNIKLSPMFKNKILCTYYPNDYLNVFSPNHVEHFLKKLDINYNIASSIEVQRETLLGFKKSNLQMKNWSNFIFAHFLYKAFDPKSLIHIANEETIEHCLNAIDSNSCYITEMKLVKQRKVNLKIVRDLKHIYNGKCQLCAMNPSENFGVDILEGHHIEYFSKSQNNNSDNILLVCPNCHSILHKLNPIFNDETLSYEFENGNILALQENKHLNNIK